MSDEKQPPDIPSNVPIRTFEVRTEHKPEQPIEIKPDGPTPVSPFAKYNGPNPHTPAKLTAAAERAERRRKAYELWLWNTPFHQIAQINKTSVSVAFGDVQRHARDLDRLNPQGTENTRKKLVAQCDRAMRAIATKVAAGDVKAVEQFRGLIQEKAKLTGTYAPVKVASTTPDGENWAPLATVAMQNFTDDELKVLLKAGEMKLLPTAPEQTQPDVIDAVPVAVK